MDHDVTGGPGIGGRGGGLGRLTRRVMHHGSLEYKVVFLWNGKDSYINDIKKENQNNKGSFRNQLFFISVSFYTAISAQTMDMRLKYTYLSICLSPHCVPVNQRCTGCPLTVYL